MQESIAQLRSLAREQPQLATSLFQENPALAYAVLCVMENMHPSSVPENGWPEEAFVQLSVGNTAGREREQNRDKRENLVLSTTVTMHTSEGRERAESEKRTGPPPMKKEKLVHPPDHTNSAERALLKGMTPKQREKIQSLTDAQLQQIPSEKRDKIIRLRELLRPE